MAALPPLNDPVAQAAADAAAVAGAGGGGGAGGVPPAGVLHLR
jgi:hypothetical protein